MLRITSDLVSYYNPILKLSNCCKYVCVNWYVVNITNDIVHLISSVNNLKFKV